jgi:hypothetical protein
MELLAARWPSSAFGDADRGASEATATPTRLLAVVATGGGLSAHPVAPGAERAMRSVAANARDVVRIVAVFMSVSSTVVGSTRQSHAKPFVNAGRDDFCRAPFVRLWTKVGGTMVFLGVPGRERGTSPR